MIRLKKKVNKRRLSCWRVKLKKNVQLKKNKENEPSQPTLTCQIHDLVSWDRDNPIKKHETQFSINSMLKG
jgi:CO dehydrogenase/acetyl-CoA synthase alpha subunit